MIYTPSIRRQDGAYYAMVTANPAPPKLHPVGLYCPPNSFLTPADARIIIEEYLARHFNPAKGDLVQIGANPYKMLRNAIAELRRMYP
jgi:hypothetical protein